jgi:hypothetical protein
MAGGVIANTGSFVPPKTGGMFPSYQERIGKGIVDDIIQRESNIGANPYKGPTARTLFYEAAKFKPSKYGQFLLYSLGSNENNFIDAYYRSESADYNRSISSLLSKNPSAGFLVRQTNELLSKTTTGNGTPSMFTSVQNEIIGGLAAPYYWKDFLYCKYYGTIPNNYMITLRRFTTPILDNFSLPMGVKTSKKFECEGAGRPVAQAVTWFGGNTGNKLSDIISYSTGISWTPKEQSELLNQKALSQGIFNDTKNILGGVVNTSGTTVGNVGAVASGVANAAGVIFDPNNTTIENTSYYGFRDRMKDPSTGGLLSEYIWVSVDTIKKTYIRSVGLPFSWGSGETMSIVFEYDLTSVGEVNTKAAMLDIMANLLSIGTNYGNFLTPDYRYNNSFPAFGFPGGDRGLELFYTNPYQWLVEFGNELVNPDSKSQSSVREFSGSQDDLSAKFKNSMKTIQDGSMNAIQAKNFLEKEGLGGYAEKLLKLTFTPSFIENYQFPASFLTGAPIGEWHLVVGNPCNPIAMIGNLICDGVEISFSDSLGPDDFPTSMKATFKLKHARDRERGEIESIFNRGDGRLYQSARDTSASSQSSDAIRTVTGQNLETAASSILSGAGGYTNGNNQSSPGNN